ncbi:hypothetical protein EMCRGX_G025285 [Ephydatia muelleri]|eukprot:Em0021g124a
MSLLILVLTASIISIEFATANGTIANSTYHDCSHAWNEGKRESGVYTIKLSATSQPFDVFCRMTSTGGFTVMQRRMDGSVNFDRSWNDYKNGFGSLEGEHWLGLDTIHLLTQSAYTPKGVGLRVELGDFKGVFKYADYSFFVVLTEDLNYTMLLNGFNGTAGNSLGDHNSMQFSTKDRDNDLLSFKNCARDLKGGWWFTGCYSVFLNGPYAPLQEPTNPIQISWRQFNYNQSTMRWTEMMLYSNV